MAPDLMPYNITLPSGTASMRYRPSRDGDLSKGWNVSYPYGTQQAVGVHLRSPHWQGIGTGMHRTTFPGATIEFEWFGTAIYLYGTAASPDAYKIFVDGEDIGESTETDLLGKKTGLAYEKHTVSLTTSDRGGTEVAFQQAVATIGVPGSPGYYSLRLFRR